MSFDAIQFGTQIALMAVGGVCTWSVWVTKRHLKLKQDIDAAFMKIRLLEKEVSNDRICGKTCDHCDADAP